MSPDDLLLSSINCHPIETPLGIRPTQNPRCDLLRFQTPAASWPKRVADDFTSSNETHWLGDKGPPSQLRRDHQTTLKIPTHDGAR